ncbi:c-type cytochrome [Mangrovivirga sp. M17]|uniref:C-type cytochrome n=1 Tax=Mangrovivirga halotolerans TaxID=2993936 RepID=A0ABT3RQ29_9BACT|nr:c-type cytochrome [Mangrovivirga halotolerans]MCX2743903.1 c-type cytochrome [Mangrovivirga halotolerans]
MNVEKTIGKLALVLSLLVFGLSVFFILVELVNFYPDFLIDNKNETSFIENKTIDEHLPAGRKGQEIKYGYLLINQSPGYMGPQASSEQLRYTGNNLSCTSCHLDNGTRSGAASWVGVTKRYPKFRGRENRVSTLEDRINGCMERSMDGKSLPKDSPQMEAIISYMEWLGEGASDYIVQKHSGFTDIEISSYRADTLIGKAIYEQECALCHGNNGEGIKIDNKNKVYQYPPLWGHDSYNNGAGMHRVLTAAAFIKGNMPFGQATTEKPKLSDEEAIHVAAYINKYSRPIKNNTQIDFPDRKLKPISTPYGPWEDEFDSLQHKYGPFKPIADYYYQQYGLKKKK